MKNRQKWAVSLIWMLIYHRALCPMQAKGSENSTGLCTQWTQLGTRRNDLRGGSAMDTNDWAAGKTAQRIESQKMVCNFLGPIKRSKMSSMWNSRRLPVVISAVKSGRKSATLGGGGKKPPGCTWNSTGDIQSRRGFRWSQMFEARNCGL